jgi:glycosyltransferase involved in cell wall biosynthesis
MKIAIDLRTIMTGRLTGIEMVGLEISKRLVHAHPEDEFIFWYSGRKQATERIQEFKEFIGADRLSNVSFVCWNISNLLLESLWRVFYYPKLDRMLGGIDVFWEPNVRAIPVSSACRKVTTFHDLSMYVYPELLSPKDNFYYKHVIGFKREAKTASRVVVVSEATKFDLIKFFGVSPSSMSVVYNGVDEKYFEAPPKKVISDAVSKFKLPGEYILAIGSIEPRKNLINLIKALKILRERWKVDLPLLIAGGEGWFNHKAKVLEEIKAQKMSARVRFLGRVTEPEKQALLHTTSLLVYPSLYEGFGIPPLEGLAAGVPVLTSNVSSLPEAVGDAALQVSPYDPEEIAKGMAQLLRNSKLTQSLKLQGRLQAQKFSWDKAAEKMYEIFRGNY